MNQILFGVIALFMFTITGIGIAEVKTQMFTNANGETNSEVISDDSGAARVTSQSQVSAAAAASPKNSGGVSASVGVNAKAATTVPEVLAAVAREVEGALFSGWSDDGEDENEHEYGDDDEDDEDNRSSNRTSQTNTAPAPTPAPAPAPTASSNTSTNTSTSVSTVATFTMSDVAAHNSSASCYSAIGGSVYDLSSFVTKHPGGQAAIKSLCGVDGTAAYNGQHGGQGTPASVLAQYKIGVVAN
ncbi:MAG: nitrate reductase [Parcubacteria group bacterium Gr01-1014_8]|nr:MAG: nitrate reductase [Parcubacteria group bacterium Gr01-1014_8]